MLQEEIFVAPFFELVVRRDAAVTVAGRFHRGMKRNGIGIVLAAPALQHRGQIGAAAEPGFGRHDVARIHVHGRHVRIVHMRDQRNAGGKKTRVVGGAGNILAEFGGEFAEHGRDVDADFFEHAAVHHRHDAAAAGRAAMVGAAPRGARKAPGRPIRQGRAGGQSIFQRLERRNDVVAQASEPSRRGLFTLFDIHGWPKA